MFLCRCKKKVTENSATKPFLRICSRCQKEQNLDKEMYTAFKSGIQISHGSCERHSKEMYDEAGLDPTGKDLTSGPPDLKLHPELVAQYRAGKFV